MRLALLQPDIPQNCGALLRLCACLGLEADIIEPCGFRLGDRRLKRAGLDYLGEARWHRHRSWEAYRGGLQGRLVLLTTSANQPYWGFSFRPDDTIMVGRESAGVPEAVHRAVDARLVIPMRPGLRSLNVAQAAALVVGEALRQTAGFPNPNRPV
jgi:tRNA (cytidine/uridine-2'-O-)-methyltransferase